MIRRKVLETMLKKTGLTDAEFAEFMTKIDEDLSDDEATKLLAKLMSEDEAVGSDTVFSKIKGKAKDEAVAPFTKLLGTYEPKLTAEQKVEYGKLGNDLDRKYEYILNAFDTANSKTGDKNYDDLKSEYDKLQVKLTNDYVAKTEFDGVQSKLSARDQEIVNMRLTTAAGRSKRLRDITGDRHFERNFVSDAMDLLQAGIGPNKQKGVYNAETGKVMRADSPDQPLLVDNQPVTLDRLADLTITAHDSWQRKQDIPPVGTIPVPANPAGAQRLSAAQLREIEQN